MQEYLNLLRGVLGSGELRPTRAKLKSTGRGVDAYSTFGRHLSVDLARGFPMLTTKRMSFKIVKEELLWFLSGATNARPLQEKGVTIWDEWADPDTGDLGPIYGKQWRDFGGVDQIKAVEASLRNDPYGRRHIVSAWNPPELAAMALPPCHCFFQFYMSGGSVTTRPALSCHLYQRSADVFLGVPYNIASYALLTSLLASALFMVPGTLTLSFGDLHLYENHLEAAQTQLSRQPGPPPRLRINPEPSSLLSFTSSDFELLEYHPQPAIPAEVAI